MRHNDLDARIGERIRNQRKQVGLSQKELASRLDIVFQQLQKHENGTSRVPASRLFEIARALDTPVSHFYEIDQGDSSQRAPRVSDIAVLIGAKRGKLAKQVLELVAAFMEIKDERARADIVSLVTKLSKAKAPR
ncbi:helix-turn-helix transcriptional regulator [Bradyrhizobium sp. 145]|nr:helix-turn-helix transcriptional regulator [Bradyrhizobium sp. 145]